MKTAILCVLLFLVGIFAGSALLAAVNVQVGPYVLEGQETPFATADECVLAAIAGLGRDPRPCVQRIVVTGVCDAGPPALPDVVEAVAAVCPDGKRWFNRETGYVAADYPACYRLTLVPEGLDPVCNTAPVDAWTPSPDDAPKPRVDPAFDEHSPTGPGEGPPGAPTVDKPS